ncbi:MAG: hypothetical protein HY343_03200 [Lentisphaerae bacterium]|nr:hypothetical protein [Lentisphaerota bacterium]
MTTPPPSTSGSTSLRERLRGLASKRGVWLSGGLAVALLAAGLGTWFLAAKTREAARHETEKQPETSAEFVASAKTIAAQGNLEDAFAQLQQAVNLAVTPEDKAAVGFAMGEFLLSRARQQTMPYAPMARGYLEAALEIESREEQQLDIYKALAENAELLKDYASVRALCEKARDLIPEETDQLEWFMRELDVLLKVGTWPELDRIWQQAVPLRSTPSWESRFDLMEATLFEKILVNDDWYQDWLKQQTAAMDPVGRRSSLLQQTLKLFDRIAETRPELAEEALFRSSRLTVSENQFEEARRRITAYFDKAYKEHYEEILMLLIRMARLEGKTQETEAMVTQFLNRYKWYSKKASELLSVIEQAEFVGQFQEALYYIEEYLKIPAAQESAAILHFKAGQMAARMKLSDKAREHFNAVLESNPDADLHFSTLQAQADLCIERGQREEAQQFLAQALAQFPYDPRRSKVLYVISELLSKSNAPLSEKMITYAMAIESAPGDPGSVAVLMRLAKTYEDLEMLPYAQDKYAKVALLRTLDASGKAQGPDSATIGEALLGSARCLYRMNDMVKADRLLRELCHSVKPGPVYEEAVYLWGMIKVKEGQKKEARRRFALVDTAKCPPEIGMRIELERMLMDIADGQKNVQAVVRFVEGVTGLPVREQVEFSRRAYGVCFESLLAAKDIAGLQTFLDSIAAKKDELPLSAWAMQLSSLVFQEKGATAFTESLNRNVALLDKANLGGDLDLPTLTAMATSLEKMQTRVNDYIRTQ